MYSDEVSSWRGNNGGGERSKKVSETRGVAKSGKDCWLGDDPETFLDLNLDKDKEINFESVETGKPLHEKEDRFVA